MYASLVWADVFMEWFGLIILVSTGVFFHLHYCREEKSHLYVDLVQLIGGHRSGSKLNLEFLKRLYQLDVKVGQSHNIMFATPL